MFKRTLSTLALASLGFTASVHAAPVNFDFVPGNVQGTAPGQFNTSIGAVTFNGDQAGFSVQVTGWSLTRGNQNRFEQAAVTLTGRGLGVCNNEEIVFGACINAGADNLAKDEFLMFQFFGPGLLPSNVVSVNLLSVIPPVGNMLFDSDVSYWAGNLSAGAINNLTLAQFTAAFGAGLIDNGSTLPRTVLVDDEGSGQYLGFLFGAQSGENNDEFRVRSITANVPIPGTLALMGIAGLALSAARKRSAQ